MELELGFVLHDFLHKVDKELPEFFRVFKRVGAGLVLVVLHCFSEFFWVEACEVLFDYLAEGLVLFAHGIDYEHKLGL